MISGGLQGPDMRLVLLQFLCMPLWFMANRIGETGHNDAEGDH